MPRGHNPTYIGGSEPHPFKPAPDAKKTPPRVIPTGLDWDAIRNTTEEQA